MNTFIFQLQRLLSDDESLIISVKSEPQILPDDYQFEKTNDLECEKMSEHKDSPFNLSNSSQTKRIVTNATMICYSVNYEKWERVYNSCTINI